jgi:hypothetical protein
MFRKLRFQMIDDTCLKFRTLFVLCKAETDKLLQIHALKVPERTRPIDFDPRGGYKASCDPLVCTANRARIVFSVSGG